MIKKMTDDEATLLWLESQGVTEKSLKTKSGMKHMLKVLNDLLSEEPKNPVRGSRQRG